MLQKVATSHLKQNMGIKYNTLIHDFQIINCKNLIFLVKWSLNYLTGNRITERLRAF